MNNLAQHAHWLLRIGFASVFLFHGFEKFPQISGMAQMLGLPEFVMWLVALSEVAAGGLVLIGGFTHDLLTRLGGLAAIPVMLGAIVRVHWGRWSFTPTETHPMGGMEFQVVLLLIGLYFLLRGNGSGSTTANA